MRVKGLRQLIIAGALSAVLCSTVSADVWHLKDGQDWEKLAEGPRAKYLLAVAEIKQLISHKSSSDAIKKVGRKQGMKLLKENAVVKMLKGITTYNEVLRCVSQED